MRDSPLWQLDGRTRARSGDGRLELVEPATPARLRWLSAGVEPNGQLVRRVALRAAGGHRYELRFAPPAEGAVGEVRVRLGGRSQAVAVGPDAGGRAAFDLCAARGEQRGAIDLQQAVTAVGDAVYSAARLTGVRAEACR